jgi:predicted outer membrane lipoprotein
MKLLHNLTLKNIYGGRYLLLATAVLAGFLTWLLGNPFAIAFAALIVVGGNALRSRHLDALDRRMAAVDGPVWDIELNQVKVGTISDAEYAAIRHKCFIDRFNEAAVTALRKHCKAAAEGSIVLVLWTNGVLHFNDELAHMQPDEKDFPHA